MRFSPGVLPPAPYLVVIVFLFFFLQQQIFIDTLQHVLIVSPLNILLKVLVCAVQSSLCCIEKVLTPCGCILRGCITMLSFELSTCTGINRIQWSVLQSGSRALGENHE